MLLLLAVATANNFLKQQRLQLREIEQGRMDPYAPYSRALVEQTFSRQKTMQRNRALVLAGLKLHVQYLRDMEQVHCPHLVSLCNRDFSTSHACTSNKTKLFCSSDSLAFSVKEWQNSHLVLCVQEEQSVSRIIPSWRSKVDQTIVDLYTRDCLDVRPPRKRPDTWSANAQTYTQSQRPATMPNERSLPDDQSSLRSGGSVGHMYLRLNSFDQR